MAEEGGKPRNPAEPVIIMFVVAALLGEMFFRFDRLLMSREGLANFLQTFWLFIQGEASFAELIGSTGSPTLATLIFVFRVISFGLSGIFIWGIFSVYRKLKKATKELKAPHQPPKEIFYGVEAPKTYVNPKWAKVIAHINSENPSDWKLAILEADIILNEMLEKMNYHGETISDKLKAVEPSDFPSLQLAWEAHKVRNAIAHEGSDFQLNKPEAERVVKLFKTVFEDFKYI